MVSRIYGSIKEVSVFRMLGVVEIVKHVLWSQFQMQVCNVTGPNPGWPLSAGVWTLTTVLSLITT